MVDDEKNKKDLYTFKELEGFQAECKKFFLNEGFPYPE